MINHNTSLFLFGLVVVLNFISCTKQEANVNRIDLSGEWNFQIDSLDQGIDQKWFDMKLGDKINLPGSMTTNGKGNNFYLDNINLTTDTLSIIKNSLVQNLSKFPKHAVNLYWVKITGND